MTKLPHSCGSRDALQVFADEDGNLSGFCFACSTYVHDPLGQGKTLDDIPEKQRLGKSKEEIEEEFATIANCSAMDLKDRRLRKETLDYYGVKIGLSEQDGKTPMFHFYPYTKDGELVAYKVRHIETKNMWTIGNQRDVDLFGWPQAIATGAQRLIITEGELDAVALRKIFEIYTKEQYKDNMPAVCSLPHGASAAGKDLAKLMPRIRKHFKKVSFCFDGDSAGQLAVDAACKVAPDATVITLPAKDANECLIKGLGKAAFNAAQWKDEKAKNTRLVSADSLFEEAKAPAEYGVSWPWEKFTKLTRGIRTGETYYFAGPEKSGKSEIVSAIAAHVIKEHGWSAMLCKPEENPKRTIKGVAGKIVSNIFHDPEIAFDEEAYDEACEVMRGKVELIDVYQNITWETLRLDIVEAGNNGCKLIVIDPITCLTNGMSASERNDKLMEISQELAVLALDLDVVIMIFCHLNKAPKGATPFDRGGKITTDYFAGSSAMARSCHMAIALHCNKDPELTEEERNMRELTILADRTFGVSDSVKLYWDKNTGAFNEVKDAS